VLPPALEEAHVVLLDWPRQRAESSGGTASGHLDRPDKPGRRRLPELVEDRDRLAELSMSLGSSGAPSHPRPFELAALAATAQMTSPSHQ